jgi:hypothetical protein
MHLELRLRQIIEPAQARPCQHLSRASDRQRHDDGRQRANFDLQCTTRDLNNPERLPASLCCVFEWHSHLADGDDCLAEHVRLEVRRETGKE